MTRQKSRHACILVFCGDVALVFSAAVTLCLWLLSCSRVTSTGLSWCMRSARRFTQKGEPRNGYYYTRLFRSTQVDRWKATARAVRDNRFSGVISGANAQDPARSVGIYDQ